jgi:hypothetical protein
MLGIKGRPVVMGFMVETIIMVIITARRSGSKLHVGTPQERQIYAYARAYKDQARAPKAELPVILFAIGNVFCFDSFVDVVGR